MQFDQMIDISLINIFKVIADTRFFYYECFTSRYNWNQVLCLTVKGYYGVKFYRIQIFYVISSFVNDIVVIGHS